MLDTNSYFEPKNDSTSLAAELRHRQTRGRREAMSYLPSTGKLCLRSVGDSGGLLGAVVADLELVPVGVVVHPSDGTPRVVSAVLQPAHKPIEEHTIRRRNGAQAGLPERW